jgi:hypothetical protein
MDVIIGSGGEAPGETQGKKIRVIKALNFPELRFEWHPGKMKVYVVRVGQTPEIGEVFAHDVTDLGAAHTAVQIWLRGYRTAKGERWDDSGKLIERKQDGN